MIGTYPAPAPPAPLAVGDAFVLAHETSPNGFGCVLSIHSRVPGFVIVQLQNGLVGLGLIEAIVAGREAARMYQVEV